VRGAKALQSVGRAFAERATGLGPGPIRAMVAATVTGAATAALTYKVLRRDQLSG
jgi:hypothetical protein